MSQFADTMAADLQEIAVLIDNLRSSVDALKQLGRISSALGESRTREELIPFVTEPHEDNDEHLLVLAQELGGLLSHVGGSQYATSLLTPLETLTGSDENSVRDAAVDSIRTVMKGMSSAGMLQHVLPMLTRLAKGSYPQRVAACVLCADVHQYISAADGVGVRSEFDTLTKDPLPVVRRAAASSLARLAQTAGPDHIDGLVRIFVQMAQDGHESIRRALVQHSPALAACCRSRPDASKELLQHIIALMHDRSWRVRYCAATHVHELSDAFGPDVTRSELFPHYLGLLSDTDADVRGPACAALPVICRHLEASTLAQQLRPCLMERVQDSAELVRELLAEHLVQLAPVFGRQQTIDLLLEPLLVLLRDKTPEVRLNVLRSLHSLSDIITLDQISESLLPTIDDLAAENAWRVRHELVSLAPQLATHFGEAFFQRDMVQRLLGWLGDRTAVIRTAAASAICSVCKTFGPEWTKENVLGQVALMATHSNYLFRMSVLKCLQDLSEAVPVEDLVATIVPACVRATTDAVPNLRFVASRVLQALQPKIPAEVAQAQVVPVLEGLLHDSDADVRYFASQSLAAYQSGDGEMAA